MKILVLGGNGMLGHYFLSGLQRRHEVKVTLRHSHEKYQNLNIFSEANSFFGVDVASTSNLVDVFDKFGPDAVVNATGVTKQLVDGASPECAIEINALVPHRVSRLCEDYSARMVQFSSDCIFDGSKGGYAETDPSDAKDLYGRTKYLGEVNRSHVVTIRKSTIGLELSGNHGLIEWFLAQSGGIKGFIHATYSGLITSELVRVVEMILVEHTSLSGVWNVASEPISKYDLLVRLNQRLSKQRVAIFPEKEFHCDRSLDGSRFSNATGYVAPGWDQMLDELAREIETR